MGVLRWRGELDFQIERLSGKPIRYFDVEIATILRMGVYQIGFLKKVPKSAAVNEAAELAKSARKKSAAGLVNAVLRKCEPGRRAQSFGKAVAPDLLEAARRSLPLWLLQRWEARFGSDSANSLALASASAPRLTLRVGVGERERFRKAFADEGIRSEFGRYSDSAIYVVSGNVRTSRPVLEGRAVIQDEASQLVAQLLAPQPGERVLDLCAAPGIKTSQLAATLGTGTIVACDRSGARLRTMAKLMGHWFPSGVRLLLVRLDAAKDLPFAGQFGRILVDAPCSGTGTLSRNPEIKCRLQECDLARLAKQQQEILKNALKHLAPGGRLVYATCSLEPEENEQVVEAVLQQDPSCRLSTAREISLEYPNLSSLLDSRGYLRTRPDLHSMDGFFAAVIVRLPNSNAELPA